MMRLVARLISCLLAVSALPATAWAQSGANPGWMVGKWSVGGDCDSMEYTFVLHADGTMDIRGLKAGWRVRGDKLVFDEAGNSDSYAFIRVSDDRFEVDGTAATRCGPPPAPLTAAWLTGTRWSGHSNCAVVITFASGGRANVSNGSTGTWSISGGRILLSVGSKPLSLERRSERQLVEVESRSAFVRC